MDRYLERFFPYSPSIKEKPSHLRQLGNWQEVTHTDFPDPYSKISGEKLRKAIKENPGLNARCGARIATGRFYGKKEYEARRKEILSTPLP